MLSALTPGKLGCLLLSAWSLGGCIEDFSPDSSATSKVLVVDGFISDSDGPHTIVLSTSAALTDPNPAPVTNAEVTVADNNGISYVFSESSPGVYQSTQGDLKGKAGAVYTLQIATREGKRYRSNPELLKATPPIDSVYFEAGGRYENITGDTLTGISIHVDTHDDTNGTRYYRWEWEETWEIRVPYPNTYDWVIIVPGSKDGILTPNGNHVEVCFDSRKSTDIYATTTNQLANDRVSRYELNFVDTRDYKLRSLYSVKVKQYALDEESFRYWSELKKSSESLGTLFDPQPYEIRGNIFNPDDLDEPVLGYFGASTVTEKRLFVDRRELQEVQYPMNPCEQELVEVEFRFVYDYIEAGYVIAFLGSYGSITLFMAPADCCDCRYHGTLTKPDFWIQ